MGGPDVRVRESLVAEQAVASGGPLPCLGIREGGREAQPRLPEQRLPRRESEDSLVGGPQGGIGSAVLDPVPRPHLGQHLIGKLYGPGVEPHQGIQPGVAPARTQASRAARASGLLPAPSYGSVPA